MDKHCRRSSLECASSIGVYTSTHRAGRWTEGEDSLLTQGASGGATNDAGKPQAEKPKSSSIPRGDYLEFVRLVAVCNFCAEPRQRKWQLQSLEIFIKV